MIDLKFMIPKTSPVSLVIIPLKTALIRVISDLKTNSDSKRLSILVMLDLTAAFADHDLLI